MSVDSVVRIAVLLPDLLGTYGDRGNAIVLAARLVQRGIAAEVLEVPSHLAIPASCDIYLLGGGEDVAQTEAVRLLQKSSFTEAVQAGATVLAICAGLQILGVDMTDTSGRTSAGLGLLDVRTRPGKRRSIGEIVTRANSSLGLADPVLTGFENHSGLTDLGPSVAPLAQVETGIGNGDGAEGAISGNILATYMHGPVLARNPALADHLLAMATGIVQEPVPLDDIAALRRRALSEAHVGRRARSRLITAITPRRWNTPGVPKN